MIGFSSIGKNIAKSSIDTSPGIAAGNGGRRQVQNAVEDAVENAVEKEIVEEITEQLVKETADDTAQTITKFENSGENNKNVLKTLDDILKDTKPGRATKGKTTQYVKSGSYEQAANDFDALNPQNVKEINTKFGLGKTGTLPDGRTITARPGSSEGRPTPEIRNLNRRGIEIKYGK